MEREPFGQLAVIGALAVAITLGLHPPVRARISRVQAASESAGLTGAKDEWIEAADQHRKLQIADRQGRWHHGR